MPRLAACHICATLTRLPDPPASAPLVPARIAWMEDGREVEHVYRNPDGSPVLVAAYDPSLEDWITRHGHEDVNQPDHLKFDLWHVDQITWDAENIVRKTQNDLQEAHGRMYTERDELKDDAMACFNRHGRPKDSCTDVFSESKVIGGGHDSNKVSQFIAPNDRMFLCHLCPFVHGYVIPNVRARKGYYDLNRQVRRRRRR